MSTFDNPELEANVVQINDDDGSWGFWDETWTDFTFGYATKEDATRAVKGYCDVVLEGKSDTDFAKFFLANPGKQDPPKEIQ